MERDWEAIVGRYVNRGAQVPDSGLSARHFAYCLVRLSDAGADRLEVSRFEHTVADVFRAATAVSADVSQMLGNVVLVLFGVPLESADIYEDVDSFVAKVADMPVVVVVGEEFAGLYGSVGTDDRTIVTAFSDRIVEDLARLQSLKGPGVYVRSELAGRLQGAFGRGIAATLPD